MSVHTAASRIGPSVFVVSFFALTPFSTITSAVQVPGPVAMSLPAVRA